jgi:hypothetical protein
MLIESLRSTAAALPVKTSNSLPPLGITLPIGFDKLGLHHKGYVQYPSPPLVEVQERFRG